MSTDTAILDDDYTQPFERSSLCEDTITDSSEHHVLPKNASTRIRLMFPQLQGIRSLKAGWNSHGAPAPDPAIMDAAESLLWELIQVGVSGPHHLNPTPKGGVQFEWEVKERYFEIEFESVNEVSYYFRDGKKQVIEEGTFFLGDDIGILVDLTDRVACGVR